ncbi:hypothetical protein [Nonomuraea sp. bgisy101]|uniref:hypothetical protein n=1 Tax=Nonomuraea sp. bgisy101 TaxID=3413784 RepID=UPI003D708A43
MTLTTTKTPVIPAGANSDYLRGYLGSAPGWLFHLVMPGVDEDGSDYPWAVYYRVAEPGRDTSVYVPYSDAHPEDLADAAEIINSIDGSAS